MKTVTKRLNQVIAAVLTIVALAVGQRVMAETVTYTIDGNTEMNSNVEFIATASGSATGTASTTWTYATGTSASVSLPGGISLSFGTNKSSKGMAVQDVLQIEATSTNGGYITLSHDSKYIYHVTLKYSNGNTFHEAWNMTTSYTYRFQEIGVKYIVVEYASYIPITDAVISGLSDSYSVSNAAVEPTPTVTWHGTTLTKNTHYTLSYQDNTTAGTATVKATGSGKFSPSTSVSANYTLVWATYSVRFNKNNDNATGTMSDQTFYYTEEKALTGNAFTRTGYHFDRWTTNADGTGNSYTNGQSVSNLTAENGVTVDLYAQWAPNTYTVTLDNQGATTAGTTEVTATFDAAMPAITVPTKTDYIFGGYYTEANGGGTKYYNANGTSANSWNIDDNTTLYAYWIFDWATGFAGTESDPYMINDSEQFNLLAQRVNSGTGDDYASSGYSGRYFRLGNNITITTPIGNSKDRSFKGTFDGDGKTLTLNLTTTYYSENLIAPFKYINGATIKRLHTAGTITTNGKMAGGIVGDSYGTSTIQSCRSSVAITTSTYGDGTHGGLVGRVQDGKLTITDCLFDGSITGANTDRCGGFVGWKDASLELNRCLQAGDLTGISNSGGSTFCRYNSGFVDFSTCYYKTAYGTVQGTQTSATGGDLQALLGSNWEISGDKVVPVMDYRNLSIATIENLSTYYIYTGSPLEISYTVRDTKGKVLTKGTDYTESFSPTTMKELGIYTLTITGTGNEVSGYYGSHTINFKVYQPLSGQGTPTNPYVIASADDWELFAYMTANSSFAGEYFRLDADISVSEIASTNESYGFSGDFNGNGHKITLTLSCNDPYIGDNEQDQGLALFRFAGYGCTIRNLTVDGTITTVNKFAAGFISYITQATISNKKNIVLHNCRSSVTINSTRSGDATTAGFVAMSKGYVNLTLENCLFDGSFESSTATQFAGFVGYQENDGQTTITNSLVAPTSIALTANDGNHRTFCRFDTDRYLSLTNCYYRTAIGTAQGTNANDMDNPSLKDALGSNWEISGDKVVPRCYQLLFSGQGTSTDPYVIASADDWALFVDIAANNSFIGEFFRLDADISASEMASTNESYGFSGNFNGNGHKITLTLSCNDPYTGDNEQDQGLALFRFAGYGCTIHDLTVDGTITTVNKFAAGFISYITQGQKNNYKNVVLSNCRSSVSINSTRSGDATTAGFVAMSKGYVNLTLNNCLFDGSFESSTAKQFAGFVGWQDINGLTTITNSLVAPASIALTANDGNHRTFCRYSTDDNLSLTNSYYHTAIGEAQGTQVYLMTLGDQISATPAAAFTYKSSHYYTEGTAVTLSYTGGSETLTMPAMDVIPLLNGFDNSSVIANNTGSGKNVVLTDRTLYKDGDWNTLCLPFNLAISGSVLDDDNVDVRTLSSTDFNSITGELTLTFTDKDDVTQLVAGKPYIIKWSKNDPSDPALTNLVNPTFTNVTVSSATANVSTDYVDFIGTTSPVVYDAGTAHKDVLFLGSGSTLNYPDGSKASTINACRAYFELKNGLTAGDVQDARLFFGDDEDTGIRPTPNPSLNGGEWYTLDGRKLDKQPTKAGLYIHNGMKVAIK